MITSSARSTDHDSTFTSLGLHAPAEEYRFADDAVFETKQASSAATQQPDQLVEFARELRSSALRSTI